MLGQHEAAPLCRRAAATAPPRPGCLYDLGISLSRADLWKEAVHALRRAAALSSESVETRLALAEALLASSRFDEAASAFDAVLGLDPRALDDPAERALYERAIRLAASA